MPDTAVQAHRGSPDAATGVHENTLEAFRRARGLGADGVELDVRLTGTEPWPSIMIPRSRTRGPIIELAAAGLPESVPLLADALEACAGLAVNIEIKNLPGEPGFDPAERLAASVADMVVADGPGGIRGGLVLLARGPRRGPRTCPEIATGLLVAHWFDPAECVPVALSRSCTALHPHAQPGGRGAGGRGPMTSGLSVAAWTVNDRLQLSELASMGVDTVITDDVPLALSALDRG